VCDRLEEEIELARLVGRDEVFLRTIEKIPPIAASEAPVLLLGETGTGKEVCARAIHHLSQRRNLPFIPVECGAIPEQLAENEFFGHCRGAFTDAHIDQKGLAAMAEGGTLFLDEIDSLSLGVQAKLLRFLEEGSYRSLGGDRLRQANVRIIAAANRDLESLVAEKQFRADLYFRVNVLQLRLPALRERRGDIGLLAGHFLDLLTGRDGARRKTLSPGALHRLGQHNWPGNVRELFNLVQRVVALCPDSLILAGHIPLSASSSNPALSPANFRQARAQAIGSFERSYVADALRRHAGNITRAAATAGKDRRAFGRLVKKYGIDPQTLPSTPGRFGPASGSS
jgi:DNA-binding NtrC family response regulator